MSPDPDVLEEFLAGRYLAIVGTYRTDGTVQLTANWYIAEGGTIYLPTFEQSYKVKNVQCDPRAAVIVDSRGVGPMRAAATNGPATTIEGAEALAIARRCWERYVTPAGMEDPGLGGMLCGHDPVCVAVEAGSWSWTDQGEIFSNKLEDPQLVYPHSP